MACIQVAVCALQKQKEAAQQAAETSEAATATPSNTQADVPAAEEAGNRRNNLVHAWVLVQPGEREVGVEISLRHNHAQAVCKLNSELATVSTHF